MKKIIILLAIAATAMYSCNNNKKENVEDLPLETEVVVSQEEASEIIEGVIQSSNVKWTGFKTTEKVGVSGNFDAVQVMDTKEGNTPEEVLEGAKVRVAVSSINSGASDRDSKLRMVLFGAMENTSDILGTINFKDGKTYITFTLNNVSKKYEVTSKFENHVFTINTVVDLADFKANEAVEALNMACEQLHKGPDGITKTWSEVEIEGMIKFSDSFGK